MYQTKAFVLSSSDRREADQMVTLYTERFGLISALAIGVKKPVAKLRGHLERFVKTDVMLVSGSRGYRLIGAILVDPHLYLKKFPERLRAVEAMATLLLRIAFEGHDATIWEIFDNISHYLNSESLPDNAADIALLWGAARLSMAFGYQPSIDDALAANRNVQHALKNFEELDLLQCSQNLDLNLKELGLSLFQALQCSYQLRTNEHFEFLMPSERAIMTYNRLITNNE